MDIQDTDGVEILEAIERLYAKRLKLPKDNLFPTVQPLAKPAHEPGGAFWLSIAISDGQFPLEEQFPEQCREDLRFVVTGYTRMQLDEGGRDRKLLTDLTRGLFAIKRKILSIVGEELARKDKTPISADRVYAVSAAKPDHDASKGIGWISVTFGVSYDWNLTEAEDEPTL